METELNASLLVDGKAAFDEILNCIDNAQKSIFINMFIWRDDEIGCQIADAILKAADRGVKVMISVDRVGMVLELSEEYGKSFFHENPTLYERFKIEILKIAYSKNVAKEKKDTPSSFLIEKILSHPNITVDKDREKNDHSKFYVFDDRILIFGGINIEEKERSGDCLGRIYQDYMLKIENEKYVNAFFNKIHQNKDTADGCFFRMNNKTINPAEFEMYDRFLSIINEAQKELVIVMAYFAPVSKIVDAIVGSWKRGVHIRILVPEYPNFLHDSNRRTIRLLMKRCRNNIEGYFSPKMVHTKLIFNENTIMFGSSNITNLAFKKLGELDIELENNNSPLVRHLKESVEENFSLSRKVEQYDQIQFSLFRAIAEGFFN